MRSLSPIQRSALLGLTGFGAVRAALVAVGAVVATRLLDPADRGLMVLGVTMGGIAAVLVGMGTGSVLRSRLPGATEAGRRLLIAAFTWWAALSAAVAGSLAVAFSALSARLIDPALGDPRFLAALFLNAASQVTLTHLPDVWYAGGRFRMGSGWATVVIGAGTIGTLGGAAIGRSAGPVLAAQGAAMAAIGALQVAHLRGSGLLSLRRLPWRRVIDLPRAGVCALGMTFGLLVALRLDRFALGVVTGPAEVAVYSLATTLCGLPALVPIAVGQLALREVAAGAGPAYVRRACGQALRWAALSSLPVLAGGWLLIVPVFGPEFAGARPLLAVLLVAGVIYAPFEVAGRSLLGGGWMGTAGLLGVTGCLLAVVLQTTLTPRFGPPGAAWACGILYAILSTTAWFAIRYRLNSRRRSATPENGPPVIKSPAELYL